MKQTAQPSRADCKKQRKGMKKRRPDAEMSAFGMKAAAPQEPITHRYNRRQSSGEPLASLDALHSTPFALGNEVLPVARIGKDSRGLNELLEAPKRRVDVFERVRHDFYAAERFATTNAIVHEAPLRKRKDARFRAPGVPLGGSLTLRPPVPHRVVAQTLRAFLVATLAEAPFGEVPLKLEPDALPIAELLDVLRLAPSLVDAVGE
jgi:hypothetical protein